MNALEREGIISVLKNQNETMQKILENDNLGTVIATHEMMMIEQIIKKNKIIIEDMRCNI